MQNLQLQYTKNLQYFNTHHKELAQRVQKCVLKTYSIAYQMENKATNEGFFNLQVGEKKELYYSQSPKKDAVEMMKNINNGRDFFTTKILNEDSNSLSIRIGEYIDAETYIQQFSYEQTDRNAPSKVVCFGTAIGAHLHELIAVTPSLKALFIIEPDMELFKCSFYFADYEAIAQNRKLFFSVGESSNQEETYSEFKSFQQIFASHNFSIKFLFLKNNLRRFIPNITEEYLKTNFYELSFEHYLSTHRNAYQNLLTHPSIDFEQTKADIAKPVLLIMSGPSLAKNIDFIKEARNKFLLVAVGSSLFPMYQNDIVVDICFTMDGKRRKREEFANIDVTYLQKIKFIASEITDPSVSDFLKPMICYGKNQRTVGHYALGVLSEWGFKNIYTLGNDVSVGETLNEYLPGLEFKEKLVQPVIEPKDGYSYDHIISVKGNFRDEVKSKMKFYSYVTTYEVMKKYYLFDKNVYNLSDGAYIEGLTPMQPSSIDLESMPDIDKNIIDFKLNLPQESKVIRFNIESNMSQLLDIVKRIDAFKLQDSYNSLVEYIYYRDRYFINDFSSRMKKLRDSGGMIRYVLFFDNLIFSFLDNSSIDYITLNKHLKILSGLFFAGLRQVALESIKTLEYAKKLSKKMKQEENSDDVYLSLPSYGSNATIFNNYLLSKYYLHKNTPHKIAIHTLLNDQAIFKDLSKDIGINKTLISLEVDGVYKQDLSGYFTVHQAQKEIQTNHTDKHQNLLHKDNKTYTLDIKPSHTKEPLSQLVENILYQADIVGQIPHNEQDLLLVVCNKNKFEEHHKQLLMQMNAIGVKRIHFHIVNTSYVEEVTNEIDQFPSLDVTITIQNKFVFFEQFAHYQAAFTYQFISALLDNGVENIVLFNIMSLIGNAEDLSTLWQQKSPITFYRDAENSLSYKDVVCIHNAPMAKTILSELLVNAKMNIYLFAPMSEVNSDLELIYHLHKNNIDILPKKYCDEDLRSDSVVWLEKAEKSVRFENKKNQLLQNKQQTVATSSIAQKNQQILDKKNQGVLGSNDIKDYNGFVDYEFINQNNERLTFSMFSALGDDEWIGSYLKNHLYQHPVLLLWSELCAKAKHLVIDKDASNGIFSILALRQHKDTITIEKNISDFSRTKLNLKTNHYLVDQLFWQNKQENIALKQAKKLNEKISLYKAKLSQNSIRELRDIIVYQGELPEVIYSLSQEPSQEEKEIFKTLGYSNCFVSAYEAKYEDSYNNHPFIWLKSKYSSHPTSTNDDII